MATADPNLPNAAITPGGPVDLEQERAQARRLAARYRCGFIDLQEQRIDRGSVPNHSCGLDVPLQLCAVDDARRQCW